MLKCHISLSTLIPKHSSLSTLLQKLFITTCQQWQLARNCLWRVSSDNIVIKFINNEDNFQITILNCEFKDGYLKNHCNWIMYKDGYTKPSLNVYTFFAFSLSYWTIVGLILTLCLLSGSALVVLLHLDFFVATLRELVHSLCLFLFSIPSRLTQF